jgi:Family of unknown function (DUF6069)
MNAPNDPDRPDWAGQTKPYGYRTGYEQPPAYSGQQPPAYSGQQSPAYSGQQPPGRPPSSRPYVEAGRLWAGGAATAVVAGLIALLGVLVCRWLLNIPLLAPKSQGAYGDVNTTTLVLLSALAALVATGLAHLLLLTTPRPMAFFAWIIGLATVLAVVVTFSTSAPLNQKGATAVVYVIIGIAIGSLISGVAAMATRPRGPRDYPAPPDRYADRGGPPRYN